MTPHVPFDAVVLTSQQAVTALGKCLAVSDETPRLPTTWRTCPFYVVGPRTKSLLHALDPHLIIKGEGCGDADSLAEELYSSNIHSILFLCGHRRRDSIEKLRDCGVEVELVEVYETKQNPRFDSQLESILSDYQKTPLSTICVGLFSPSSADACLPLLLDLFRERPMSTRIRCICIGKTTGCAVENHSRTFAVPIDISICAAPTPKAFVDAILCNKS